MTDKEALLRALEALHYCEALNRDADERKMQAITVIRKLWTEHAMREVQRLGQEIEQEPVAHLWECIGRWSAYLVNNGEQADCAPPSWLVDAVNNATTPPKETK